MNHFMGDLQKKNMNQPRDEKFYFFKIKFVTIFMILK